MIEKNKTEIIDKLTEILSERDEIIFAYLFGSINKRDFFRDIDVAIFISAEKLSEENFSKDYGYITEVLAELNTALNTDKIDLILLNTANLLMFKQIIYTGKLLVDKNKYERIYIENSKIKEYIDAENLRKIKQHYFIKKTTKYNA